MPAIRAALVDLDGTVWRGERLLPGAREGLESLRDAGVSVAFVTNSASVRPAAVADRLAAEGLPFEGSVVVTAASATAAYVADRWPGARVFVLGSDALAAECREEGLDVVDAGPADVLAVSRVSDLSEDVLAGALAATTSGTAIVATSAEPTHPVEGGVRPGAGATVGAVAGMTEREPTVVGKPSTRMAEAAAGALGVDPGECLVVGDRVDTDVRMGHDAGMTTVLVLSGVADAPDASGTVRPDHVLDSLADIETVLE